MFRAGKTARRPSRSFKPMEGTVMLAPFQSDPTSADAADTASMYVQTNLVSDIAGLGAMATDPHLVNPWGVSFMNGSPFWISDQGSNVTTLYPMTDSTPVSNTPTTPVPVS